MKYDRIEFEPVVFTALDSLRRGRDEIWAEIQDLVNNPEARPNVRESDWSGAEYVLIPSVDPSLRVYFRTDVTKRVVEVIDVIRPDALRSIFAGMGAGRAAP